MFSNTWPSQAGCTRDVTGQPAASKIDELLREMQCPGWSIAASSRGGGESQGKLQRPRADFAASRARNKQRRGLSSLATQSHTSSRFPSPLLSLFSPCCCSLILVLLRRFCFFRSFFFYIHVTILVPSIHNLVSQHRLLMLFCTSMEEAKYK